MPIAALPQTTIRAIGSSSVISDPCSVVKELLDNALDASASFVSIEISQNTLDVIQVKDNGHGIPSDDHALVCKRTFTSKIQTVDDLKNIGGNYLGFRGEALASAAEMSSSITITTRVEAERVGSSIKYGRNGEPTSSQRASHPVGTTVRISDFLKYIPVRRQTAQRGSAKTLTKIKKMVQSYAMAQPSKRLSLKVLKAKNESNNWVYAPKHQATLIDAALKIVGTDIASCCVTKHWPSDPSMAHCEQPGVGEASGYQLTALLPRSDAELSKINHAGQFFSADSRPLTTSRGIGHDITKTFKSYLRATASSKGQSTTNTDPFLYLQIRCPEGSYDVNIEPAKDDVLFERPGLVLSLVEDLFRDAYGGLPGSHPESPTACRKNGKSKREDGFDLLMAQKGSDECTPRPQGARKQQNSNAYLTPFKSPLPVNFQRNHANADQSRQEAVSPTDGNAEPKDLESLNPWVLTKMNAPNRSPVKGHSRLDSSRRPSLPAAKLSREMTGPELQQDLSSSALTSPANAIFSTSTSPTGSFQSPLSFQAPTQPSSAPERDSTRDATRQRDRDRYGNGTLGTWFEKTTRVALDQNSMNAETEQEQMEPSLSQLAGARFGSPGKPGPRDPVPSTPHSHIDPDASDEPLGFQRASRLLVQGTSLGTVHGGAPISRNTARALPSSSSERQQSPANDTNLAEALDFEQRKKDAMQKNRLQLKSRFKVPVATNSPDHSRYLAARAALSSDGVLNAEEQTPRSPDTTAESTLSHEDPRAHLMRQQNAQPGTRATKLQRTQTKQLPFERIPASYDIHDVCLSCPVDISLLPAQLSKAATVDSYARTGTDLHSLITPDSEELLWFWKSRLSGLVKSQYKAKDGPQDPVSSINFAAMIHHLKNVKQTADLNVSVA